MIAYLEGMDDLNIRIFKKSTSFVDCDDGDLECVACPIFVTAIPRGFWRQSSQQKHTFHNFRIWTWDEPQYTF